MRASNTAEARDYQQGDHDTSKEPLMKASWGKPFQKRLHIFRTDFDDRKWQGEREGAEMKSSREKLKEEESDDEDQEGVENHCFGAETGAKWL